MARHAITLKIAKGIDVQNVDIEIQVEKNGNRFGTITISKGSIEWRPAKAWSGGKSEVSLPWTKFDKVMRDV
ncbi:MAG TPA: hypothetical protein VN678_10930 [Acidobacteriaceae bacterium]|nr:hypothetical protein [Acidobacteriaceae bacterium]